MEGGKWNLVQFLVWQTFFIENGSLRYVCVYMSGHIAQRGPLF